MVLTTEQKTVLKNYYDNSNNLCLIAEGLRGKETSFFNPEGKIIRCIKAGAPRYLKQNMDHFMLIHNEYNIYRSIANYRDIPLFSWKKEIRHKQYEAWTFNKIFKKYVTGYDYYIDFDNKDHDDAYVRAEVQEVSDYFSKKGFKHMIYSSGSGYYIKAKLKEETPEYAKNVTEKLIKTLGLTTPDLSIYKWQALIKVPYSVDVKTMNICTPIKPDMFSCFDKKKTCII